MASPSVYVDYLNRFDIVETDVYDDEILTAVDRGLREQGMGNTVLGERTHLLPDSGVEGHFNVLRGWIGGSVNRAGIKVVGDFHDNYLEDRPSEYGLLALFDPATGAPRALLDATAITDMRTGAMTALGSRHLAPSKPRVLGHVGARGSAYWNVRLLDRLHGFETIRVHSRRAESRESFAERLERDLGKPVKAVDSWQECVEGADVVVEASRLTEPQPLLKTEWIKKGALVVPYGTKSALEDDLTDIMDKVVVDDWGQVSVGPLGALRRHVDSGRITRETLHAELCEIAVGTRPGRESEDETILFWHRGMSLSDIALGQAILEKATALGIGQRLRFA